MGPVVRILPGTISHPPLFSIVADMIVIQYNEEEIMKKKVYSPLHIKFRGAGRN